MTNTFEAHIARRKFVSDTALRILNSLDNVRAVRVLTAGKFEVELVDGTALTFQLTDFQPARTHAREDTQT